MEILLQLGAAVFSVLATIISSLLGRNIGLIDKKLDDISAELKEIRDEVGDQAARLAAGDVEIRNLKERVGKLEDRERERLGKGAA